MQPEGQPSNAEDCECILLGFSALLSTIVVLDPSPPGTTTYPPTSSSEVVFDELVSYDDPPSPFSEESN